MKNRTWNKRATKEFKDTLLVLKNSLPSFKKESWFNNKYLDVIIKQPFKDDNRQIPVAAVSKTYSLVQHTEIFEILIEVLNELEITELVENKCQMIVTEYYESMKLNVPFKETYLFPDDVIVVKEITCINSVDQSSALEIGIIWKRNNCEFLFGQNSQLRLTHTSSKMDIDKIKSFLSDSLKLSNNAIDQLNAYYNKKVNNNALEQWLNTDVESKWGVKLKSRLKNIIKTGEDKIEEPGKIKSYFESNGNKLKDNWNNLYNIYMALVRIANDQTCLEAQFKKVGDAQELFNILNNKYIKK